MFAGPAKETQKPKRFYRRGAESTAQRRRRYREDGARIVEYANAWGDLAAMEEFDIRSPGTLDRIRQREGRNNGNRPVPLLSRQALYPSDASMYDGLVKGIVRHINALQDKVAVLEAAVAYRDAELDGLRGQLQSLDVVSRQHETVVMTQLANLIE